MTRRDLLLSIAAVPLALRVAREEPPAFATGTGYAERTGPAMLHQGEAVVPAGSLHYGKDARIRALGTFDVGVDWTWGEAVARPDTIGPAARKLRGALQRASGAFDVPR